MTSLIVTRFAPSPTGALHLGNARTALFNWFYARKLGGRFLLRIEDTDRARSDESQVGALMAELRWLGLDWDAGPDLEDAKGPYRQSAREERYREATTRLMSAQRAYHCFCTPLELELARKAALSRGLPPRYPGTCSHLNDAAQEAKRREGRESTVRFRVPLGEAVVYEDLVRGPQRFMSDELGDFVIQRADGTASFLFCNALDDAAMGVTHVLRGEDHVANTPRQHLILQALGAQIPAYGHLPLLVGSDGAPLSKRHGSASVADIRDAGYLPNAVLNLLARLGHSGALDGWADTRALIAHFELEALGRAPAHFDLTQLTHWQKEEVHRAPLETLLSWAKGKVPAGQEGAFIAAVRQNLVLPADAAVWAPIVYGELPCAEGAIEALLRAAGSAFFEVAATAVSEGADYAALLARLKSRTGLVGKALFHPLRAALTQRLDGPELAQLLLIIPRAQLIARFQVAAAVAVKGTDASS